MSNYFFVLRHVLTSPCYVHCACSKMNFVCHLVHQNSVSFRVPWSLSFFLAFVVVVDEFVRFLDQSVAYSLHGIFFCFGVFVVVIEDTIVVALVYRVNVNSCNRPHGDGGCY